MVGGGSETTTEKTVRVSVCVCVCVGGQKQEKRRAAGGGAAAAAPFGVVGDDVIEDMKKKKEEGEGEEAMATPNGVATAPLAGAALFQMIWSLWYRQIDTILPPFLSLFSSFDVIDVHTLDGRRWRRLSPASL